MFENLFKTPWWGKGEWVEVDSGYVVVTVSENGSSWDVELGLIKKYRNKHTGETRTRDTGSRTGPRETVFEDPTDKYLTIEARFLKWSNSATVEHISKHDIYKGPDYENE